MLEMTQVKCLFAMLVVLPAMEWGDYVGFGNDTKIRIVFFL